MRLRQMIARRLHAKSIFGLLALAMLPSAWADQIEYTAYSFSDNKDNGVFTSSFNLAKTLWDRATLLLDIELDQITVPPLIDGASGASRPARKKSEEFKKNRGQIIVGLEQGLGDNTSFTGSYYHSREIDYLSHSYIASFKQEFFQKNLTIDLRGQYTADSVGEILLEGGVLNRLRETHTAEITVTQLLTPKTYVKFAGVMTRNLGFLSDPYRKVNLPGRGLVPEHHPDTRWRNAVCADLSRYLERIRGSTVLHYRYYWDDWGVVSQTAQIKFNKYVGKNFILSPEYRYYIQGAADFSGYGGTSVFHTADYKLQAFESNNIGAGLTWLLRDYGRNPNLDFLSGASVALLYFRYWNTLDFSGDVVEGRVKFDF
jgi:Protein of unknown function (DUF3570)